jgi:dTDP-4-dehydrorhamnose reductase
MAAYESIVITGGGGMLAHALVDAMRARDLSAVVLTRADCDITNRSDVSRLFQSHRPTLLLNCAAHTGVDLCEDEPQRANAINGEGPGLLAKMAREYRTRLIHFSTDFVFDGQIDRPYRPDDRPNPLSAYGRSKVLGEARIQEAAPPDWLILRTAWLFGRHGSCFPQTIVKLAQAGRPLRVVDDQIGCPTFTVDLAAATLKLIDSSASGIFHVTNSGVTSWYAFAAAILKEFGLSADLSPVTTTHWLELRPKQAKRPAYSVLDVEAYTSAANHSLRHWSEALSEYRQSLGDNSAMS